MRKTAFASVILALTLTPVAAQEEALVTEFGIAFKPRDATLTKTRQRVEIDGTVPGDAPRYYRLRIRVNNPDHQEWAIAVRSPVGQILTAFDQSQTNCESEAGCWTRRLTSRLPVVQFSTASETVRAEVIDGLYMPSQPAKTFYSPMQGSRDELVTALGFNSREEKAAMQSLSDNLGMFIGSGPRADGTHANWCCSGVRLTADLFMTNWHCGAAPRMVDEAYWQTERCHQAIVDLSWDGDDEGREYACRAVEFADKDLDVAILRLSPLADGPTLVRPLTSPRLTTRAVTAGEKVLVLHHPACAPKSVTRECSVLKPGIGTWTAPRNQGTPSPNQATEFTHNCTTENGSSGGPVFSAEAELVGLHHLGVSPMRLEPGNFAVGMDAILSAIKTEKADLYQEIGAPADP
ncbi:trypsin-like serine peptidase [Rhizobium sp. G187]|uniref:trypsin-like serine peptidase n=1 Tax=Rhizobium sp. G187 TaxID=3451352 RepID=UPI003EE5D645